jgi:hypothetical protein
VHIWPWVGDEKTANNTAAIRKGETSIVNQTQRP